MNVPPSSRGVAALIAFVLSGSLPGLSVEQAKPAFFESFEEAPFEAGASVEGVGAWRITSSNVSLEERAGMIHSGSAADGVRFLEITSRGTTPGDSTRVVHDFAEESIALRPGSTQRIAVAMNYVNLSDFVSGGGIIFRVYTDHGEFGVSLNSKGQNAGLLRRAAKTKSSEHLESGQLLKADTWYRFVIDLSPPAASGGNATLRVTLSGARDTKVLWDVPSWDLGFSPSRIVKIEMAANRLVDPDGHRLGRFDQIEISEIPTP